MDARAGSDDRDPDGLRLTWNDPAQREPAAAFAGAVIGRDTAYISHGEIQTGLADALDRWVDDLAARYRDDFLDLGDDRDLLVAGRADGSIAGIAIVAWEETARRRFAVLEDMVVDTHTRSRGIGSRLLAAVQQRVDARGTEWLFLESGVRNARAHAFFERNGFVMTSHVFARQTRHDL